MNIQHCLLWHSDVLSGLQEALSWGHSWAWTALSGPSCSLHLLPKGAALFKLRWEGSLLLLGCGLTLPLSSPAPWWLLLEPALTLVCCYAFVWGTQACGCSLPPLVPCCTGPQVSASLPWRSFGSPFLRDVAAGFRLFCVRMGQGCVAVRGGRDEPCHK